MNINNNNRNRNKNNKNQNKMKNKIILNNIQMQNSINKINKLNKLKNKNRWVVFLTTAVNVKNESDNRIQLYNSQIMQWLNNTNFYIYVIESTGYEFNIQHDRLKCISFNFPNCGSSTIGEANSLLYLFNEIKNDEHFINCTHVLKVTGRYYLKNIEYDLNNRCINGLSTYLQYTHDYNIQWQNTEYFGIDKNLLENFLLTILNHDPASYNNLMEHKWYHFIFDNKLSYQRIGPFENNIARGGDGIIIKNL